MHDEDGSETPVPGSAGDGGLAVAQTAQQLGISTDAVRRRLKAGELSGHRRRTKHGPAWCVHPGEPPGSRNGSATVAATVAPGVQEGSASVPPGSAPIEDDAGQLEQAPGMALLQAEAMAAYTRSVLEPLVAALERSEEHARQLERENGRLSAELGAEREARSALEVRTASESVEPSTAPTPVTVDPLAPLWRRMWLVLATLLALILAIVIVALLVVPR